jgi:hypothetical protein
MFPPASILNGGFAFIPEEEEVLKIQTDLDQAERACGLY